MTKRTKEKVEALCSSLFNDIFFYSFIFIVSYENLFCIFKILLSTSCFKQVLRKKNNKEEESAFEIVGKDEGRVGREEYNN